MASERQLVEAALNDGNGIFRLEPAWVPRSFCIPGRRLKLHPEDYYSYGANRGGIDERWLSSTTRADNGPLTSPFEGLSFIHVTDDSRVLLKDAIEMAGEEILGKEVMQRYGGWKV